MQRGRYHQLPYAVNACVTYTCQALARAMAVAARRTATIIPSKAFTQKGAC